MSPERGCPSMPEWVRVKDPVTGHEFSVSAEQANAVGAKPINKEATDGTGNPRPVLLHRTIEEAAAAGWKGA